MNWRTTMKTYAVAALRADRAIYYAFEYGLKRANQILAEEPKRGMHLVRVPGGTAKRTNGLFARKAEADKWMLRIREVTAAMRAKLTGQIYGGGSAEVVAV
jgi:hypothetical protein